MSYDLILYFDCGCSGNIHDFNCYIQKQFRITTETEPGYWCVRLGSFAIPDLEDIKHKALNDWRMYEFDVIVEPPLKKFERHSRKSYVGLVSMEKEYMERLNVLITEMEQWFGPMRDYTPYLIEVCSRDPNLPKKHPELLQFEEFRIGVTEIRLVEYDSGPHDAEPCIIDDKPTYKTVWRLKLLNSGNDPEVIKIQNQMRTSKMKTRHTRKLLLIILFVTLLGLVAILAFLLYYFREDIF